MLVHVSFIILWLPTCHDMHLTSSRCCCSESNFYFEAVLKYIQPYISKCTYSFKLCICLYNSKPC